MKLLSYLHPESNCDQLGVVFNDKVYNLHQLHRDLPDNMAEFLLGEEDTMVLAKAFYAKIKAGYVPKAPAIPLNTLVVLSPVVSPSSCRTACSVKSHMALLRRQMGMKMSALFYQFPSLQFINHQAIYGQGLIELMPDCLQALDFGTAVAIVIGKGGENISPHEADEHIGGFMLANTLSARQLQFEEMRMALGTAKGKDFYTILGPYLLSPDELEQFVIPTPKHHVGKHYALPIKTWVNKRLVAHSNLQNMHWTFAEIIARASYGTELLPGDVILSGTLDMGCFLAINAQHNTKQYLKSGDTVSLQAPGFGQLRNRIKRADIPVSILRYAKKRLK